MLEVRLIFQENLNVEARKTKAKTAGTGILKDLCPEFTKLKPCSFE